MATSDRDRDAREQARTDLEHDAHPLPASEDDVVEANPPRTTDGKVTTPKFGSAGSGGAELEPGPPRP